MKHSKFLRRSLAMLLLLATLLSLVPNVFAAEETGDIDNIVIDVPEHLKGEDVVTASFGEDGKITYDYASDEVRSAINAGTVTTKAITDSSGATILENRAGNDFAKAQRLAFFIDPSNSEGNANYVKFTLNATIIKNLVAAGVTDLFVMTKNRAGTFSLTDLKTANTNKGSAKVYAWMHCARDDAYLKSNKNSTQYHFRAGYNNSQNGGDTSVTGWVNLGYAAYITYMEGLVAQATSYADGLLLDSVRFGTEYTGWGQEAKDYMGKTNYNNAVKALCVTAGSSNYSYSTGSDGFYVYKKGSAAATGDSLATIITNATAAATSLGNYRKSVITNFIGKMKTKFGSSKIIAVALERDWENTNYYKYIKGQDPYNFRNHVKKGFCVTMQVVDYHSTAPATMAKQVAKYTNVMVGVDFYKVGTVGNYGYTYPDTITDVAESIFTARYQVASTYKTYRGYILGAACYTAGHIGAVKASLSGSGTSPTLTATVANPNKKTVAMLTYFNKHGDTDCSPNTTDGSGLQLNGTMHYYSWQYYINSYSSQTGSNISAFGAATIQVKLKNYTVDWDKLPFIRFGFYVVNDLGTYLDCVGHFPIYIIANHASCTTFTTSWISAAANCTTKGFKKHVCTTCSYTYIEEVAALGHNYTVEQSRVNPTCEAPGSVVKKCSRCTSTTTETLAALGHNYVPTVTAPTCLDGGYTTYTCSRDSSHTYVDNYTAAAGHTFVNGTCTVCGFSLAKLIHFKENSEENTWDWQLIGGSNLGFDTSTDGAMYGTTDGMTKAYFYIDPAEYGNLNYTINDGDVIQIRMRVRTTQSAATTATPSVSLEMASGIEYGATISGNAIDLNTSEWQIVTIPVNGYAAGETAERIRINMFGDELVAANVEIDYIHFGQAEAAPITVTFYNYNGKALQVSPIAPGTKVTFYGETPTKPTSAGFTYTFTGWMATSASTGGALITDLSTVTFSENTALTAQFEAEFTDTEPLNSNKQLVDDDNDLEDYTYDIQIDASTYGQNVTINKEYKTPLDIVIVMDRSTSVMYPADHDDDYVITSDAALTTALSKLDKTKPQGYYTATNWLGIDYAGSSDVQSGGFISYEDLRYNTANSRWEVWQTITTDEAKTLFGTATTPGQYYVAGNDWTILCRPGSVVVNHGNFAYQQEPFGSWVPVSQAYSDFIKRRDVSFADKWETTEGGLAGYTASNIKYHIGISRRGLMQEALVDFVQSVYDTTDQLPNGQYHRIALVSYAYGAYLKGRTANYSYTYNGTEYSGSYTTTVDLGVTKSEITLNSTGNLNTLLTAINQPFAFGSTYTDDGLKLAQTYMDSMDPSSRDAQGVVVLFTDGAPTYGANFMLETATAALTVAKAMKQKGVKIFSVGFMDGLNSATALKTWNAGDTEAVKANNFLHLVSSNYPDSTAMTSTGNGSSTAGYYMSDTSGDQLATIFSNIFSFTDSSTTVQTQITGPLLIKDIVTREWDVLKDSSNALDITVERCDYIGLGDFKDPVVLDPSLYTLTTKELIDGETEIQVEWKDAPNAWLREAEAADANGYMGYELLITIGITLDRDSTIGGNNIDTNTPDSGIFYPTNHDLDHTYDVPNVNVEMIYDHKVHDYFLDLHNDSATFDLIDALSTTDQKDYKLDVYENLYSRTVDVDGKNNKYVNIEHFAGDGVYSEYLTSATTEWTETFNEPTFDFKNDRSGIPVRYEVTPITSNVDSLGREPFGVKKPVQTASVNYYAPKYMVVDYHTTAVIAMGNETAAKLGSEVILTDNGVFDSTGNNVRYTFRNDSDNGNEKPHIMTDIEEIGYTVTAINAPKGADSNTVNRTIHIIPANNVSYDFEALTKYEYVSGSGYTGSWTADGSYDNTRQNHKDSEIHGYDSTLQTSGADDVHSYGRSYKTTVSDNIRDESGNITEYHNNNALIFTFKGTGFDILSQTGPDEGIMIVEVYKEGTTTLVKRYMVDNYLADKTLYQIPVVHCMGLAYDSYDVVIRGFYNVAFSHYVEPETTEAMVAAERSSANMMTEAKLRELLGLNEDDLLEYSLSTDRAKTTRALSSNSYDIHVDGVRIYNTLSDTITATSNPVANYAYKLANELNAQFKNVHGIMLDATTWKYGSLLTEGLLYVATGGRETTSAATDSGLHLSSNGIYNYSVVDGVKYLINADGEYITHPEYNSNVYVEIGSTDGKTTCTYYCNKTEGNTVTKVELSATDVGQLIGQSKIVFYNSDYTVNSPKNEVYLSGNNGLAFNATGATMLQISAKSIDGTAVVLQVYDWTSNEFVDAPAFAATTNATEMYYNIHSYVDSSGVTHKLIADNGDVVIRNFNDETYTGVISICNVKVIGATITPPANASKAVDLIISPPEMNDCEHSELAYGEAHAPTCVDEGNIEFWYCDDCECYYTDAEATVLIPGYLTVIAPTGEHDYINDVCSICGDEEFGDTEAIIDENLTASTAITVGAQMKVAYSILASNVAEYESFYLEVSKEVANAEPIVTVFDLDDFEAMTDPISGDVLMYSAIYCGVNAKEMGDSFTATLYAITADGTVYCGGASTMTIRDYLLAKAENAESSAELKTMAIDMLNYGAAAQMYFGYNTDHLANADLTEEQAALATKLAPEIEAVNAIAGDGVNISTNVVLGNEVTLNLSSVYTSENADLLYVIKDAKTGEIVAELKPETLADIFHKAAFADVSAKNMRKALTIELYDGDTLVSKTLTWSIEGYAAELLANENITEALRDLLNAMLTYGDAVAAYMSTIA